MDLNLSETTLGSDVVVQVRGEVDVHSAPQLRDRLLDVIDSGNAKVLVDLTRLGFIDSTGLGALVAAQQHASENQVALHVVCSAERVLRLFRITGLDQILSVYSTLDQAVMSSTPISE